MAIINIIDEGTQHELTVVSKPYVKNSQLKFVFSDIRIRKKTPIVSPLVTVIRGTGATNSIVPPVLVNSSTTQNATEKYYTATPYIHSAFPKVQTYTPMYKDFQGSQTTTIKIRGSYVADNATTDTSGPYWS